MKNEITGSSNEMMKANRAAETMPGVICGSVTQPQRPAASWPRRKRRAFEVDVEPVGATHGVRTTTAASASAVCARRRSLLRNRFRRRPRTRRALPARAQLAWQAFALCQPLRKSRRALSRRPCSALHSSSFARAQVISFFHLRPEPPLACRKIVRGYRLQHIPDARSGCHHVDRPFTLLALLVGHVVKRSSRGTNPPGRGE